MVDGGGLRRSVLMAAAGLVLACAVWPPTWATAAGETRTLGAKNPARTPPARAKTKANAKRPRRWENHIRRFEAADKKAPPPAGAILFLGSSSIVRWDTPKWFPKRTTINRGFGGSQVADSLEFADRILTPYRPRTVVFYAGDNDIAAGKTPEQVLADYKALVAKVHAVLPETKFIYVAIKPSRARWKLWFEMRRANALVAALGRRQKDPRLQYLDIATPTLSGDGMPPANKWFVKDGLHLSPEGYRLWTSLTVPLLDKAPRSAREQASAPSVQN